MGVYLSEPETRKTTVCDSKGNLQFCCSEMQGNSFLIQAGVRAWRMLPSTYLILGMATPFSQSLMAMEVQSFLFRQLSQ